MSLSQQSKFAATFIVLALSLSTLAAAQTVGSGNTAFIEPPVPHAKTKPCVVQLYKNFKFNNFNSHPFTYTPPAACPGPWDTVVLSADFSISAGVQFDRTANIWIGPTNIYFGTTAEDQPGEGRHWHIERNLTSYSSLFTVPQDGDADLGNVVNSTYTGVLYGNAELLFYPLAPAEKAPSVADQVIGFSSGPTGGTVGLGSPTNLLEETVTLPTNIESMFLDVFAQGQSNDEFWYTCVPNDVASELESCPSTAFREGEVTIDGTPAGVAPIYPWIFTGGIDPFLWIPIPGVQTMNFTPYAVNLTPFAGTLNDGNPHTIALSVFNADNYFSATAALRLYLDAASTSVTGGITSNTLAVPSPTVVEDLNVTKSGDLVGTINTKSAHQFAIKGYVNTSHGLVDTTVSQDVNFTNLQYFKLSNTQYEQDIKQGTVVHSVVTTESSSGVNATLVNRDWPIIVDINVQVASDGSETQTTTSNQYYEADSEARHDGVASSFSLLKNRVITTDTLNFNASGNFTGNTNQHSSQNFFSSNSTGYCYSGDLTAADDLLTSVTYGIGCE